MDIIDYLEVPAQTLLATFILKQTGIVNNMWMAFLYSLGANVAVAYTYPMLRGFIIKKQALNMQQDIGAFAQTSSRVQSSSTENGYRGGSLRPPFGFGLGF